MKVTCSKFQVKNIKNKIPFLDFKYLILTFDGADSEE